MKRAWALLNKISDEDRLRFYGIVWIEVGSYERGPIVCALADSAGLEGALQMLNRPLAHPHLLAGRQAF